MSTGTDHHCPNCGAALSARLGHAKMIACDYCQSTVLLDDGALRKAGEAGVMAEEPSLFVLGQGLTCGGAHYTPVGQARFAYRTGWWDEFWAIDDAGAGVWFSVDEGDIAMERPWEIAVDLNPAALRLGDTILLEGERFRITEADTARCEALRGEFPEALSLGQTYRYWHLSGPASRLVTLEYDEHGGFGASEGLWIDPFEVRTDAEARR